VLPDSLNDSTNMAEIILQVEKDRIKDMVKESQKGGSENLMKLAEREFEENRQRLLDLVMQEASVRTAPAVEHLEAELARVAADFKRTSEAEGNLRKSVNKMAEKLQAAEAKNQEAEKQMNYSTTRAANAKAAMAGKKSKVPEMRKELQTVKGALIESQKRSAKLDGPLSEAASEQQVHKIAIRELQKEKDSLSAELAEVAETLKEWHAMRAQAASLHAQSAEILNKDATTCKSTPRD